MLTLKAPVEKLHLVKPQYAKALNRLGIYDLIDLLYYFPRDWQDLSELTSIAQIQPNEKVNLKVKIKKLAETRTRWRRMHLLEALLEDKTGNIVAIWYNQPFLKNVLKAGREYYMSGKAAFRETLRLQNPTFELVKEETIHTAGIIPAYELTEGLTQKQMRYFLSQAIDLAVKLPDILPNEIRKKNNFPRLPLALRSIHFPEGNEALRGAKARFAFEELFLFQLALLTFKSKLKTLPAPSIPFQAELVKQFVASLPFTLTHSQRLAVWEILKSLAKSHPMNRILEGEVGSGKTVVAGLAMLEVAHAGYQSVMLAPTEILALQHQETLKELYKNTDIEIALLTRSHKIGQALDIEDGVIKIVIGTHALLQEHVRFKNIGLLIIDEQHRFGVKQRAHLARDQGGLVPHLLSMTATPIPRTLALTLYGDLDISELRELPKGRKKIITRLVEPDKRPLAYEFIKKQILAGRQVYVVTPLIEESENLAVKTAETELKNLKKIFPEFQIGLIHGRLKGEEKKEIMGKFKNGETQILVSTSVIEVGLDVANASVMVIENAERFGLSQLHQLRGRVGRAGHQSFCLLFAENLSEYTRERLQAVVNSNDGFELAEKDLELRGHGEIIGTKQSGFIPFKVAKLSDKKTIKLAKHEAETLLANDPDLSGFPLLKQKVEQIAKNAHLE